MLPGGTCSFFNLHGPRAVLATHMQFEELLTTATWISEWMLAHGSTLPRDEVDVAAVKGQLLVCQLVELQLSRL